MSATEQVMELRAVLETMTLTPIARRLAFITEQLILLNRNLGELLAAESSARVQGFLASQESTTSGREQSARLSALPHTEEIHRVRAKIAAFNDERDLLRLLVEHHYAANASDLPDLDSRTA
ncbi:MAG: hypothetical protein KatS3mg015_2930 [Fimbriimonadales bacterium]|nr:MAG: hypothetical protein KatS3mg015_2930 [Fimbriimonadales bacterium]